MKKRKLSLLLVGMILLVGCGKKETITPDQLLGNPYGAVAESGDFDITVNIKDNTGDKTITGNLQYDKDGLHYKGSDSEYYIIRSNSYVERYDLVKDTGRWTVRDEASLDTSVIPALGIITSPNLSDWVLTGDSTFDKAGRFGMEIGGIPGEAPLAVTLHFDKDSKRLLRAEYTLTGEQPGGLKAYSLSVAINGINNTRVQLPSDIKNNALSGNQGTSSVPTQMLPDELIGTVRIGVRGSEYQDYVEVMEKLGVSGTDYNGDVYLTMDDFNKIALEVQERRGLTPISPEESTSESTEESGGTELTPSEGTEEEPEPEAEEPTSNPPLNVSGKPIDTILSDLEIRYPQLLQEDFSEEDGTSIVLELAAVAAQDKETALTYCQTWDSNEGYYNKSVAVLVDCGVISLEECVSNGADRAGLQALIDNLG